LLTFNFFFGYQRSQPGSKKIKTSNNQQQPKATGIKSKPKATEKLCNCFDSSKFNEEIQQLVEKLHSDPPNIQTFPFHEDFFKSHPSNLLCYEHQIKSIIIHYFKNHENNCMKGHNVKNIENLLNGKYPMLRNEYCNECCKFWSTSSLFLKDHLQSIYPRYFYQRLCDLQDVKKTKKQKKKLSNHCSRV